MKNISRTGYLGILTIAVAVLATLPFAILRQQKSTADTPSGKSMKLLHTQADFSREQTLSRNPRHSTHKERQTPVQWLASVSESEGTIHEKLAQLQAGLPHHNIISLWDAMILKSSWLYSGQLPGSEKWESEMIFNTLLDALVEAGAKAQAAGEATASITSLFCQLIATRQNDGVLRDYAIQRGLILAADSIPPDSTDRQSIIHTTLEELTTENLDAFHTGTALNTLLSFKAQWSQAEHAQIQDRIESLISSLPENIMATPPTTPGTPDLQVRIPLLTAIGGWQIRSALPLLQQAIHSGQSSLQIPAIAAWSQFPQDLQEHTQLHQQIETWATSQSPLRYAAEAALSHNTTLTP